MISVTSTCGSVTQFSPKLRQVVQLTPFMNMLFSVDSANTSATLNAFPYRSLAHCMDIMFPSGVYCIIAK